MTDVEFILYVNDQQKSTAFYEFVLQNKPILNVLGMTEFKLLEHVKLGLMPENGIAKILDNKTPHPKSGNGIPRCELYLRVNNPEVFMERAIQKGGKNISKLQPRDWNENVGYVSDIDGHIIAFAEENKST